MTFGYDTIGACLADSPKEAILMSQFDEIVQNESQQSHQFGE